MTDDLFRRSAQLDAALAKADPEGTINRLIASGRVNRRMIRFVIAAICVLTVFVAGNVFLYFRVASNSNAIRQVCHIEHTLWGPLLEENRRHPQTYATQAERERAERITRVFQHTLDMCKE